MIDFEKFGSRINREFKKCGLSLREIARTLQGQSLSTWSRAVNGKPLSADAYLWFCAEFQINPKWAYKHQPYGKERP